MSRSTLPNIPPMTMKGITKAIRRGLNPLRVEQPLSGTQWANRYFKLPSGSSQISGQWETLFYQVVPLNLMTSDLVASVSWQKSARIGYTKLLVAANFYYIHHKGRNPVIYQPTDDDAKDFTVDEIDGAIADMPAMQSIFPAWDSKSLHNTVKKKYFAGKGVTLDIKGIKSPKNARRITKQVVSRDEVDAWDLEVGKEGCPIKLTGKRLEGAHAPKEINGTTPTNEGESHIERLMAAADWKLRLYLPCPHCGGEQYLKWGGKDEKHGIKWDRATENDGDALMRSVHYQCEHCHQPFLFSDLPEMGKKCRWKTENGYYIPNHEDRLEFLSPLGIPVAPPRKVGLYLNALYSLTGSSGWAGIVQEFLEAKGDQLKIKTFINTVLGELYADRTSDMHDPQQLHQYRREHYAAEVPDEVLLLTQGIDTQDDRYEVSTWGWGKDEEGWLISHRVFTGDPASERLKGLVEDEINRTFTREDGAKLGVVKVCWDSGGHYTSTVYEMSRRMGAQRVLPIIGARVSGKPIATMPMKRNKNKVYLTEVGTDSVKEILTNRLALQREQANQPKPYALHFPANSPHQDTASEEYFKQLCGFRKKPEFRNGKRVIRWTDTGYVRVEAGDCFVYAYAALNVMQTRFGVDLNKMAAARKPDAPKGKTLAELGAILGG
ncbi:phage terminase large subunit family protein [Vibrio cholerae]|nr:phage terminase large subunit family protein [Vibrio cholerae]